MNELNKNILEKNILEKNILIKPLSQNELACGWKLVVPRVKRMIKTYKDEHENIVTKQGYNTYRSKVNMAQLPYFLWNKVRVFKNGNIRVNDKSHQFLIIPTNVDQEIKELVLLINKPYDILHRDEICNLLNILKDNNVYGWPVIIANDKYNIL